MYTGVPQIGPHPLYLQGALTSRTPAYTHPAGQLSAAVLGNTAGSCSGLQASLTEANRAYNAPVSLPLDTQIYSGQWPGPAFGSAPPVYLTLRTVTPRGERSPLREPIVLGYTYAQWQALTPGQKFYALQDAVYSRYQHPIYQRAEHLDLTPVVDFTAETRRLKVAALTSTARNLGCAVKPGGAIVTDSPMSLGEKAIVFGAVVGLVALAWPSK